ncbi:adenylate/guanylate cyclase domain-containing protein [Nisaea denitrificans]|uniref:adenylate/guanylate cyclase domain-containing protein n=1 Tax=Nisaea denitrificans TaxID=390877 RepID=UPI0004173D49|nr:adenylate/guanylate cyclase domain-containing protein [Nisaea denitrificans]
MSDKLTTSSHTITIRTLLLRDIGGLFLIALGAVLAVTLYFGNQGGLIVIRENANATIKSIKQTLSLHIRPALKAAELVGQYTMPNGAPMSATAQGMARTAMQLQPHIRALAFLRNDGSMEWIAPDGRMGSRQITAGSIEEQAVKEARQIGEPYLASAIYAENAGLTLISARSPIYDRNHTYLGVAAAAISPLDISIFLRDADIAGGSVFVLDEKDRLLAHPILTDPSMQALMSAEKPLLSATELGDPVLAALMDPERRDVGTVDESNGTQFWTTTVAGTEYVALSQKVSVAHGKLYTVGMYVDLSTTSYSDMLRYLTYGAIAGLIVMGLAMLRLRQLAERIRQPVAELASASNAVAKLDLEAIPEIRGNPVREFNDAADAFNAMISGLAQFRVYVPRSLVMEILRERGSQGVPSVEREVTVLFSDIVGFTGISQQYPPDELVEMLNAHFTLMNEAIEAEGGNIDKYSGDSVMAFWGAPAIREDHAAACLRSASRIAKLLREDNRRRVEQGGDPIHIRIGIATGTAIVGNIGAPDRINYTIIGDSVNVANRIEQLGKQVEPDADICILVAAETATAAGNPTNITDVGLFELRGRTGAVQVFQLNLDDTDLGQRL